MDENVTNTEETVHEKENEQTGKAAGIHLLEWIGNREYKVFAWSNTDYRQLKHEIQSKGITNPEILEFVNQDRWIEKTRI